MKTFGPLIQKIVLDIVNWHENKVIIVLNFMNWNENRVQILWVQELEWKEGKIFQRKRTGEPWNENVDPKKLEDNVAKTWRSTQLCSVLPGFSKIERGGGGYDMLIKYLS